ncbi:MAG: hypothetical protein IH591_09290, partial [Bacteroidales bacterium]|nr:hypothetical protein [Bacteroidales bacterium]
MSKSASCGNRGEDVRSDVHVSITLHDEGGLVIGLESKVSRLYGDDILHQVQTILSHCGIADAVVEITDSGALPFVLAERLEAAIRQVLDTNNE